MPRTLLWLSLPHQFWSCLKVIVLRKFLNCLWWLKMKNLEKPRHAKSLSSTSPHWSPEEPAEPPGNHLGLLLKLSPHAKTTHRTPYARLETL
ncbi:hypothetical protein A6R68_08804, partial [Neotoma lepida]